MTPAMFMTHPLPLSEQFEAWRGWYASVFDTTSRQPARRRLPRQDSDVDAGRLRVQPRFHAADFDEPHQDPDTPQPGGSLVRQRLARRAHRSSRSAVAGRWCRQGAVRLLPRRRDVTASGRWTGIQLYLARDSFQAIAPLLDAARGTALDYARRPSARRLHAAAGAQYSASAGRGRAEARAGDPGDAGRMPRPVGRSAGGSRQPYRSHADGKSATGRSQKPALAVPRAGQAVPRGRDVAFAALPPARGRGRRGSLHPAPAALGELFDAVRCVEQSVRSARSPRCCASPTGRASAGRFGGNSA